MPHRRVEHAACPLAVPVGFWRSVGHSHNAFFTECFMDELARAASRDPFEFRLAHLAPETREHRLLTHLREHWQPPLTAGRARGVAVHESFGSVVAQIAEVSLKDGKPRVHTIACAIDCGTVVNPDTVFAQMESGIVFGLSAALYGEIGYSAGRITQQNFFDYRILSLAEMPQIEVFILASDAPPGGVGEPGTPPVAPAVANAFARLTGRPVRSLPLVKV